MKFRFIEKHKNKDTIGRICPRTGWEKWFGEYKCRVIVWSDKLIRYSSRWCRKKFMGNCFLKRAWIQVIRAGWNNQKTLEWGWIAFPECQKYCICDAIKKMLIEFWLHFWYTLYNYVLGIHQKHVMWQTDGLVALFNRTFIVKQSFQNKQSTIK